MKGMTDVAEDNNILTLEEASELFKVSTKTFLKMLREEDLPARKLAGNGVSPNRPCWNGWRGASLRSMSRPRTR